MKVRVGDVLSGKYEVERHLAKGGMGSVWVARDLKLCRRVAVKFIEIAPKDDADAATMHKRFEREALAVARLNTPHVVQVYDHALDSETPYIVMEYLEGEGLSARFAREGRLSFSAAVGIMNQAARGLRAAHEAGIVHRDLKPANIFLAEVDHEQMVKILDFGIAKLLDHRGLTVDGEIFGSARYMSPEQIFGAKDLDLRSDLWSMGVILYRAITGSDAFSSDIVETVQALRLGRFPPATTVTPHLLPEVDGFFERALAVDKNRRFLSAVEMAEAFAELASKQAASTTHDHAVAPKHPAPQPPKTTRLDDRTTDPRSRSVDDRTTDPRSRSVDDRTTDPRSRSVDDRTTDPRSRSIEAIAPATTEPLSTAHVDAFAPTDLVEPTDLDAPTELDAPELDAPMELDAPTPLMTEKLLAEAPPHDEETLSATARETRSAQPARRPRARILAVAVVGLAAATAFALWPRSHPVVSDVGSPAAADRVAPPAPAPQPAQPEAAESVATPSPTEPPADSEAAAPAPSSSVAEAPSPTSGVEPTRPPAGPAPSWHPASAHGSATPRPAAAKPSCNPAYTVDADGIRHPIKACL